MASDANSVLMGAGVPSAKIDLGLPPVTGRITAISEPYQEREYDPKNPGVPGPLKTFPSGDPIMSFSIDIATGQIDPSIENDEGTRRIYMDGGRIKKAVREAVKAAGAKGVSVGGWLSITCVSYDEPGNRQSGKNYAVQYVPGAPANDVLMGQAVGQQPPAPPVAQQPAYPPQQPPVVQGLPAGYQPAQPPPAWNPGVPGYPAQGMPAPQQPAYAPPAAPQAPAQPPAPAVAQQPVQAPQAPAAGPSPEQVAAVKAAGMDPAAFWPGYVDAPPF